jgi:hypothetical protein
LNVQVSLGSGLSLFIVAAFRPKRKSSSLEEKKKVRDTLTIDEYDVERRFHRGGDLVRIKSLYIRIADEFP